MLRRNFLPLLALPAFGAKSRLKSAICAYSFRDQLQKGTLRYEDLVPMAVENEVDGLDLTVYWFPSTDSSFLLPLKRLAYRQGVEIYSISVRTNMCQPTAELRDKEVADVKKWIDVAATLGAGHIRVFGGTVPKTSNEDEAAKWVVDVLSRGAAYAGTKGVILGLENHGGITARVAYCRERDRPFKPCARGLPHAAASTQHRRRRRRALGADVWILTTLQ